jgi:tRNA-dihydrouridine synthase
MIGRGAQGQPWLPGQIGRRLASGIAERVPELSQQFDYTRSLYDEVIRHYGVRIGSRHARKHLGWSLDFAAKHSGAPPVSLKEWRQKILTNETPGDVHRLLKDAFDDFSWSAAA